jgi:hypothetical protein
MRCCQTYRKSCPEPVSTVNVHITNVSFADGNIDMFKQETLTADGDGLWFLSHLPYSDGSLSIYINGVLQKPGRDYTRDAKQIIFDIDPAFIDLSTSTVRAVYFGTEYATLESALRPGMIVGAGTAAGYSFIGFLVCDGASYLRSAKPRLYAAIGVTYGPGDVPGTTFQVPNVEMAFVDGDNNFATGPAYIKE